MSEYCITKRAGDLLCKVDDTGVLLTLGRVLDDDASRDCNITASITAVLEIVLKPHESVEKRTALVSHNIVAPSPGELDHVVEILNLGVKVIKERHVDIRGTERTS